MTDFATYTNAQLNRWAAVRDGWKVEMQGEYWSGVIYHAQNTNTGEQYTSQTRDFVWNQALKNSNYAKSTDAAIALLGRWGYRWTRGFSYPSYTPFVEVSNRFTSHRAHESPECDTARALIIAANSLKESEEG
jgi:hypothetical protein